jgi:phosphate transport system substrate-binding protein
LKLFQSLTAAGVLAMAAAAPAAALDISGAGATFPYPIYAKWADAYKKETGVGMNYQSRVRIWTRTGWCSSRW